MLFYITLLLVLSAGVVQAAEEIRTLYQIGEHAVHKPLKTKKDLWEMMRKAKVREGIEGALYKAECPGTGTQKCSELFDDIYNLFPANYKNFKADNFRDVQYDKDSVIFRWMMFRHKGEGRIKVAENINWGGAKPLPAYEFNVQANDRTYVFTVPKGCGNLALLKRDCPDNNPCKECKDCSPDCKINGTNCRTTNCQTCADNGCFVEVPVEVNPCKECKDCPQDCKINGKNCGTLNCQACSDNGCFVKFPINPCEDCNDCSTDCKIKGTCESPKCKQCKNNECFVIETIYKTVYKPVVKNTCEVKNCNQCTDECVENPYGKGCPQQCQECKSIGCLRVVRVTIEKKVPFNLCEEKHCDQCSDECAENPLGEGCPPQCQECKNLKCIRVVNKPFHFIADLGYYRQSDPADYLFGRVGIEYNLSENANWLEGISLLTMIGAAPKVGGSDGDSAFLLDVIAQYNWQQGFGDSGNAIRGFTGLGLGGWFASDDTEDDSADKDLDIIANIGVRVLDTPNISVFLEMRNAVDELDSISEYGRFGAGVRFQF
jgi:hypothetical protein